MLVTQHHEKWTYQKLVAELPAESRYEIRDYNLIKMAAPFTVQQNILLNIVLLLSAFNNKNKKGFLYVSS